MSHQAVAPKFTVAKSNDSYLHMFCRQSLVVFGNLITTSTESRLHFEELCFFKAALAPFQFDNPLIIDTLSS